LAEAAELIRKHHELYDGSVYLRGLQAEIPIGSGIFAVADTLDAITSDRPYRSAQHFADSFKVIHSESGRLFDPQITGAFFSLPKETWPAIARHQHQASLLPSWLRNGGGAAPLFGSS
jgi:response regulator RpfG family c-di-GMP phosphodiesterase